MTGRAPRKLDRQEEQIVKALMRNPRVSDNKVAHLTGIPLTTVNRKRKRMEEAGLLSYYCALNMGPDGTGAFGARHLYLIEFKLGITQDQIIKEIKEEPNIRTVFTEFIYESHIAEIGGHTALALLIEGRNDDEINNKFNGSMVPSLKKNHGVDSITNVSTIRVGRPIRIFHNYLPIVNMERGVIKEDWRSAAIFTGPPAP